MIKPAIGRVVHFVPGPAWCYAPGAEIPGIIVAVRVDDEYQEIDLAVFQPAPFSPIERVERIPYSPAKAAGSWHWPERVE